MKLLEASQYRMGPWPVKWHAHPRHWELHFFAHGPGLFQTARAECAAPPGAVVLVPPKEDHAVRPLEGLCHFYYVGFVAAPNEGALLHELAKGPKPCDVGPRREAFKDQFDMILWNFASGDRQLGEAARLQFEAILRMLASPRTREQHERPALVEAALAHIRQKVDAKEGLGAVEKHFGVSRSFFDRSFRRATGRSPKRYYLECKMERARTLLEETVATLRAISDELGFSNEFYFSRLFKRLAGVSPSDYRDRFGGAGKGSRSGDGNVEVHRRRR